MMGRILMTMEQDFSDWVEAFCMNSIMRARHLRAGKLCAANCLEKSFAMLSKNPAFVFPTDVLSNRQIFSGVKEIPY